MSDPETRQPHTAHTTNLVPVMLVGGPADVAKLAPGGRLADVAPTVLDLMGLAAAARNGRPFAAGESRRRRRQRLTLLHRLVAVAALLLATVTDARAIRRRTAAGARQRRQ